MVVATSCTNVGTHEVCQSSSSEQHTDESDTVLLFIDPGLSICSPVPSISAGCPVW